MSADSDRYRVPSGKGRAETKVKGSRFLGLTEPFGSAEEAAHWIQALQKKHYDASHVCYAWRIGHDGEIATKAADSGEPSGTAGAPIFAAIERADITDCAVAVIRWFGGTKLGTGGLVRAYGECAGLAVAAAPVETRTRRTALIVEFDYPHANVVIRLAARVGAVETDSDYGTAIRINYGVPASRVDELREGIIEATAGNARFP